MPNTQDRVVGAGKLYFDPFVDNTETTTGELYIGNTPTLVVTSTYNELPHYTADEDVQTMDDNFTLRTDRNGSFSTDNINMENVGLAWGNDPVTETVTSATAQSQTLTGVKLGRFYQLGTATAPDGVTSVSNVTVTIGVTSVTASGNFIVDVTTGRIQILDTATDITDGDNLIVAFDRGAASRPLVTEKGTQREGALRFIAANRKGPNKDYFWPRVRIAPNGDIALKGDAWQTISFNFVVLTPSDGRERVYTRER